MADFGKRLACWNLVCETILGVQHAHYLIHICEMDVCFPADADCLCPFFQDTSRIKIPPENS
ncbi:hypothetical protein CA13_63910 [Planctomycetes bacterium CA13]|uniref:Uncharacterized protein n=1 Tax=Novipirellula herctigrandis TaxID=2527986 RepID=A0A5C5ZCL0_9BACT|nr:hypothetical protein CA13_63910 [Planctomycetes bacterium CA13]